MRRPRRYVRTGAQAALALLLPLAWGCASAPEADLEASRVEAQECITGTVVAEGMPIAPRTLVRPGDAPAVEVMGAFAGNVRRLAGGVVEACGPGRTPDGALEVTRVRLIEVDGMPALLGTLRSAVSGWVLEPLHGGNPVILAAVPERLQAAEGEVVWVAGLATPDTLTVRSFAVLEGWR